MRSDLLPAEIYLIERAALRTRVMESRRLRTIPLGERAFLRFEDRLSVQFRVQEALCEVTHPTSAAIEDALSAWQPLLPDGSSLKAVLRIALAAHGTPADLPGIEHRVYAEVEGLGRNFAVVRQAPAGDEEGWAGDMPLPLLSFFFSPAQIEALRAGAEFGFGIDDQRMRVGHTLRRASRAALLADLV